MAEFAQAGLGRILSDGMRILLTPATNMRAALLIYGIIAILILLVLLIAVVWVLGTPEDEQLAYDVREAAEESADGAGGEFDREATTDVAAESASAATDVAQRSSGRPERVPADAQSRALTAAVVVVAFVAVWLASGYTTSQSSVCTSCHGSASQHAAGTVSGDPHARVECVSCHEAGGAVGRYVTGVPVRVLHFALATPTRDASAYGPVASRACESCHERALKSRNTSSRGIRMSHIEPLDASATCIDCHRIRGGIVSRHNAGMRACMSCHRDGTASAECPTCHVDDLPLASDNSARKVQIANVRCDGCHDQEQQCDTCHGARMPHSDAFKAGGHARAAALDIWYGGGKGCKRCHTSTNHPCTNCHTSLMGRAHGASFAPVHKTATPDACNTCHIGSAFYTTRGFCEDLCHSPQAVSASRQ